MKRKITFAAVLVVVFSAAFALVIISSGTYRTPDVSPEELLAEWGKIEKHFASTDAADTIIAQGNNIVIYESEVKKHIAFANLTSSKVSEDEAIHAISLRKALHAEAVRLGFTVSDEEVRLQLEREKEMLAQAGNLSDVRTYLQGAGLTMDEYFEQQYEPRRQSMIDGKYIDWVRTEYVANSSKPFEYDEFCEELVRKEKVSRNRAGQPVKPLESAFTTTFTPTVLVDTKIVETTTTLVATTAPAPAPYPPQTTR